MKTILTICTLFLSLNAHSELKLDATINKWVSRASSTNAYTDAAYKTILDGIKEQLGLQVDYSDVNLDTYDRFNYLSYIGSIAAINGNVKRAFEISDFLFSFNSKTAKIESLTIKIEIADYYSKHHDSESALSLFRDVVNISKEISKDAENQFRSSVSGYYIKYGYLDIARDHISKISDPLYQGTALSDLARKLAELNRYSEVNDLLEKYKYSDQLIFEICSSALGGVINSKRALDQ